MGLNRVAVGDVCRTMTQGSSCLAHLGTGTESRWNSQSGRDSAIQPSAAKPQPKERGFVTSCVRQKICFERVTAFSLPLLLKKRRGPGRGGPFYQFPLSPTLSPLVPREEREAERRRLFACRIQLVLGPAGTVPVALRFYESNASVALKVRRITATLRCTMKSGGVGHCSPSCWRVVR